MNKPIEKPIRNLAKKLLADSEHCEALLALTFLPEGKISVHGAGLITTNPELALFGTARLLFGLLSNYQHNAAASLTLSVDDQATLSIQATGSANEDPRATIFLIARALIELAKVVHDADNHVQVNETPDSPDQSLQE